MGDGVEFFDLCVDFGLFFVENADEQGIKYELNEEDGEDDEGGEVGPAGRVLGDFEGCVDEVVFFELAFVQIEVEVLGLLENVLISESGVEQTGSVDQSEASDVEGQEVVVLLHVLDSEHQSRLHPLEVLLPE